MVIFRGFESKDGEAFRESYGQLAQIRSLLIHPAPMVALTATATTKVTKAVIDSLGLNSPKVISNIPNKDNIKYSVVKSNTKDPSSIFQHYVNEIAAKGYETEKVLVFARKNDHITSIYDAFDNPMQKQYKTFKTRPYAKYTADTDRDVLDYVLKSFGAADGKVRFLVASVAFGMGIDCQELHSVIHYGPPSSLDDYFQQSGRAGRDGKKSQAIIIKYPHSCQSPKIKQEMKDYCSKKDVCRRKTLLSQYSTDGMKPLSELHDCCDICAQLCSCGNCETTSDLQHKLVLSPLNKKQKPRCILNQQGREVLKDSLMGLYQQFSNTSEGVLLNGDMASGFPFMAIKEIIDVANHDFNENSIIFFTSILNTNLIPKIMELVKNVLKQHEFVRQEAIDNENDGDDDNDNDINGSDLEDRSDSDESDNSIHEDTDSSENSYLSSSDF